MNPRGKPRSRPGGGNKGKKTATPSKSSGSSRQQARSRDPEAGPRVESPASSRRIKPGPGIRLQKHLSDLGVGSRRTVEQWITEGRIRVDGQLAELGQRVTDGSRISLNGRPVNRRRLQTRDTRVIAYNKTEGEICSRDDPGNRPTVFRYLPKLKGARWVAVGRLDINTRGLLLFTNNGDLANSLMHPSAALEREYLCRVFGNVDDAALSKLCDGVLLDGEQIGFKQVQRQRGEGRNTWYRVVVTEGRYREVRRLWESVGCQVSRLVRVRYGPVKLPRGLRPGESKELTPGDVNALVRSVEPGRQDEAVSARKSARPGRQGNVKSARGRQRTHRR